MKNILILLVLVTSFGYNYSQNIGAGTNAPTNFFHIQPPGGTINPLRVEGLQYGVEQNIMVVNTNGEVTFMTADDVLGNVDPNFLDSLVLAVVFTNLDTIYDSISELLLRDTAWINELEDSLNFTETLTFTSNTDTLIMYTDENGDTDTIDIAAMVDYIMTNNPAYDDQNIQGSGLTGTILTIGIENGTSQNVDLQAIVDSAIANIPPSSDDQIIDVFSLSGTTLNLSIEDDGQATQTVNLSGLQDGTGTDDQTIDVFSLSGTTLNLSLESDGQPTQTVNLSALGGSDDQTIDVLSLSGTTLNISLEDDGQPTQTVNLSSLQDGTGSDDQTIDVFSLSGTTLNLSLEGDGQATQTVNLSSLAGGSGDLTAIVAGNGLGGTSLAGPIPTLNVQANNGLSIVSDNVRLGGSLLTNTTVNQGAFTMNFSGSGDFSVDGNTFYVDNSTNFVGIGLNNPSQKLEVNGRLKTNGINETSDRRYKKEIRDLENALDNVMKLRGVDYKWRQDEFPTHEFQDGVQLGVIAQEIEEVLPQVVYTDNNGYKSVDYSHIVPVLIEAIKDLNKAHTKEIELLKAENNSLKSSVEDNQRSIEFILKSLNQDGVSKK